MLRCCSTCCWSACELPGRLAALVHVLPEAQGFLKPRHVGLAVNRSSRNGTGSLASSKGMPCWSEVRRPHPPQAMLCKKQLWFSMYDTVWMAWLAHQASPIPSPSAGCLGPSSAFDCLQGAGRGRDFFAWPLNPLFGSLDLMTMSPE